MKKFLMALVAIMSLVLSFAASINSYAQAKTAKRPLRVKAPNSGKKSLTQQKAAIFKSFAERMKGNRTEGDPCNFATPISVGQTLNGSLAASDCQLDDGTYVDFYIFHGTSGQAVYASETSTDFDSFLFLLDTDFNTIDYNDDSGVTSDSRIPMDAGADILPFTGDYLLATNSYDPETGNYQVTLGTDAACTATQINYNQTVNGTMDSSDCLVSGLFGTDLYTFHGSAGQQVSVLMSSTAVDSYLIMHTPSGADDSLYDDDSGGGNDARIPTSGLYTLPEDGTYTIEASTYDGDEIGPYTLTLTGPTTSNVSKAMFDYDGDGKTDISVYRPSDTVWYLQNSQAGFAAYQFGAAGDVVVPADYTGDGKTDVAVFRPGTGSWFVLKSEDFTFVGGGFGMNGDTPVPGDYDGDGKADWAVYRPGAQGVFYIQGTTAGFSAVSFGIAGDQPTAGDFDGDGKADIAVYRPSTGDWYRMNSSTNDFVAIHFGQTGDKIVPADYSGDGKTDIAVWRPSNGVWYALKSEDGSLMAGQFGATGDVPVPGDYDGDGKADFAVFRQGSWYVQGTTAGFSAYSFGQTGDTPTPSSYVR